MGHLRKRLHSLRHAACQHVCATAYGSLCVIVALLFGLLNPLLCLLHCQHMVAQQHTAHAGSNHHHHQHQATNEGAALFVCHLPADTPLAAGLVMPRALYECLGVAIILIALPALLTRLPLLPTPDIRWHTFAPTSPPPKTLA